jgi:UDP-N-acetylmuramoyl-tripeptide--D-alanyl-D-alanine ligase
MDSKGLLLLNGDDVLLRHLDNQPLQRITYFGRTDGCGVQAHDICQDGTDLRFRVQAGKLSFPVELNLEGEHFVADAMAAIAVGLKLRVPSDRIAESLAVFQNMSGRQEIYQQNGYTIIQDCYNAGPESMEAALNVLRERQCEGRRIPVTLRVGSHIDCRLPADVQQPHFELLAKV